MKNLKINRKEFINKLNLVNQINPDGVFLLSTDTETQTIELVTYNNDILITKMSDEKYFDFKESFNVLISVKKLLSFFKLFDTEEIELSVDNKKVYIINNKSKHSITISDASSFPDIHNQVEFSELIFINKERLKMCLDFTDLSISKMDSAQFTLRAFKVEISKDSMAFSSCDGTQASLSKINSPFDLTNESNINLVFNLESLKKIIHFISDSTSQIEISISNNYIKFSYQNNELLINQAAVQFPDVTKVFFDDENKSEFILDIERLIKVIKLVKISETKIGNKLKFRLFENELSVELKTADGEGLESLPIEFTGKPERLFSLNDKNLIEYLLKYQEKEITFRVLDSHKLPIGLYFNQDDMEFSLSMFLSQVDN